jgi:hypothetical protein
MMVPEFCQFAWRFFGRGGGGEGVDWGTPQGLTGAQSDCFQGGTLILAFDGLAQRFSVVLPVSHPPYEWGHYWRLVLLP